MKKQHRTLTGAAALSLAVAGSLAGAVPAKADECVHCDTSPRVVALGNVLYKLDGLLDKGSPLDKASPILNVMAKIEQIILKW